MTQFSVWRRSQCNNFSLDLLKTYAIFLHRDRQLSWWSYIFERHTQFWYTEIGSFYDLKKKEKFFDRVTSFLHWDTQVSRWFYDLHKICNFLTGGYFALPGYPMKKQIVPIDTAGFPLTETTNFENRKKSTSAKIPWWQ